jgi:hypothetical protein
VLDATFACVKAVMRLWSTCPFKNNSANETPAKASMTTNVATVAKVARRVNE